ncbi:MAG: hypothetical protein Q9227_000763 [Pyrenula ochraceoflavens]
MAGNSNVPPEHELANADEWSWDIGQPRISTNARNAIHDQRPSRAQQPPLEERPIVGASQRELPHRLPKPPQASRRGTFRPPPPPTHPHNVHTTARKRNSHQLQTSDRSDLTSKVSHQQTKEHLFPRVRPRDYREEDRSEMRAKIAEGDRIITSQPVPPFEYPFQLVFLWPDGTIDIQTLIRDFNDSAINDMRLQFKCHIDFKIPTRAIVCQTIRESDIFLLQKRLEGLHREILSKWDNSNTINVVNLPSSAICMSKVALLPVSDSPADGQFCALDGYPLDEEFHSSIDERATLSRLSNEQMMRKAIFLQLQELRLTRQHVRMRLNIGKLALKRKKRPKDGRAYGLEEFEEMMSQELTQMTMNRVPLRKFDWMTLNNTCLSSGLCNSPEETFSSKFDFVDPKTQQTLRLEIDYYSNQLTNEIEITQRRWLEIAASGKQLSILEMNVLDFERYDLQFLITANDFSTNRAIQKQLLSFENSVRFEPVHEPGLSISDRRAKFQVFANKGPDSVHETCTTTYNLTGTNFKIDVIRHNTFLPSRGLPKPPEPKFEWSFSVYDPVWDVLLGELSNLAPGEEVSWIRTLGSFFPSGQDDRGKSGFNDFAETVARVLAFLNEQAIPTPKGKKAISKVGSGGTNEGSLGNSSGLTDWVVGIVSGEAASNGGPS